MKKIEIYSKSHCPYCHRAKDLLLRKGVRLIEYDVTDDTAGEQEMRERSGRRTVPQIFIDDVHVGGCDDLMAMDRQGSLDRMLKD